MMEKGDILFRLVCCAPMLFLVVSAIPIPCANDNEVDLLDLLKSI